MSIEIFNAVLEKAPVEGSKLRVLLALAEWAGDDGRCRPSLAALAARAELSDRQLRRIVRALIASGLVVLEEEGGGGRRPNLYRLALERFGAPIEGRASVALPRRGTPTEGREGLPPMSLSAPTHGSRTVRTVREPPYFCRRAFPATEAGEGQMRKSRFGSCGRWLGVRPLFPRRGFPPSPPLPPELPPCRGG